MGDEVILEMSEKMDKSVEAFKNELAKVRTGRASLSILDGIAVDAYGSSMPLNQVATGLNPANDGKIIRLSIPQLTEERRKVLVKQVKKVAEEFKVAVRNIRRDAIEALKKMKKDKEISEDDLFKFQDDAQAETDSHIKLIDEATATKEKEVMEV